MSGIESKVVAITGASSGIGAATAVRLAASGATVVLGARGLDRLRAVAERVMEAGGDVAYKQTDVRRRKNLSGLVEIACTRFGKLDVLVSNAGVMPISPLDELRVEEWEEMIDVKPEGCSVWHRSRAPRIPQTDLRPLRQHRIHSRTRESSEHVCLLRNESRRAE